jgi:hypothetical protein
VLSREAAAWFQARRGITPETLEAFGVTTEADDTVVFPYGDARKYRKGFEKDAEGGRRFWWDPPTSAGQVPFLPPDFEPRERMLLVEGETDTMAAWQGIPAELRDKVSVVGLSGTGSWAKAIRDKGGVEKLFGPAKRVFVLFDNDDPYENSDGAASVERGWQEVRADLGRKARRVVLPQGINDVAEFFEKYDWAALQVLLKRAAEPQRYYKPIDFTKEPPPVEWLVEGLFPMGEVTGLFAESGGGKSWFTMALALAVAGGDTHFLGRTVRPGRVLYVDEENPRDLVDQRLRALGMTPAHLENLDYINQQGVNLFEEPEHLIEQAIDFEPSLIVLGTLSSLSVGIESENNNTQITKLFRRGIVPLARKTGAAVVLEHHVGLDKGRPRGATAIKGNIDSALLLLEAEANGQKTGNLNLLPSKERRRLGHLTARINGEVEDGWVRVELAEEDDPF